MGFINLDGREKVQLLPKMYHTSPESITLLLLMKTVFSTRGHPYTPTPSRDSVSDLFQYISNALITGHAAHQNLSK